MKSDQFAWNSTYGDSVFRVRDKNSNFKINIHSTRIFGDFDQNFSTLSVFWGLWKFQAANLFSWGFRLVKFRVFGNFKKNFTAFKGKCFLKKTWLTMKFDV